MLRIDRHIEIPARGVYPGRPYDYPFGWMQVGDSFFAAGKQPNWRIDHWMRTLGHRYRKQQWVEDGVAGIRVFRIA